MMAQAADLGHLHRMPSQHGHKCPPSSQQDGQNAALKLAGGVAEGLSGCTFQTGIKVLAISSDNTEKF